MADKEEEEEEDEEGVEWQINNSSRASSLPSFPKVDFSLLNDLIVGGGDDEGIRIWRREIACVRLFV